MTETIRIRAGRIPLFPELEAPVKTKSATTKETTMNIANPKVEASVLDEASKLGLPDAVISWLGGLAPAVAQGVVDVVKAGEKSKPAEGGERLTARELAKCKERGVDPKKYADLKAASFGKGRR